jgi:DNA modification methylase
MVHHVFAQKGDDMAIKKESLWALDPPSPVARQRSLLTASDCRTSLYEKFKSRITTNPALDRTLVSFQGNRDAPFSGWFKYREGFSEALVTYLLKLLKPEPGTLLDPFSGAGSALFGAGALGWHTQGIEVLPVGIYATKARMIAARIDASTLSNAIAQLKQVNFAAYFDQNYAFSHIAITRGAFPSEEEKQLVGFRAYCHHYVGDTDLRTLLLYAAFCVLEEISYTRKDGQYLRWDARSGRSQGKKSFDKGRILTFREALFDKLRQFVSDLGGDFLQQPLFEDSLPPGSQRIIREPELFGGSCLELLPAMKAESLDCVLTSPPYANRYDYTRTYALELVYLGCGEEHVKQLRQAMLSCTVENKEKRAQLLNFYKGMGHEEAFQGIEAVFREQEALQEVLAILELYRRDGLLNNENITRLVRNYFYEMCFVIYELARVLRPGGVIIMVNDNVRYAGEEIPVDLILSDMAESFGLKTRHIWTLGRGKGNSSQQMGNHGRTELRKCVYVWEKPRS